MCTMCNEWVGNADKYVFNYSNNLDLDLVFFKFFHSVLPNLSVLNSLEEFRIRKLPPESISKKRLKVLE